MHLSEIILTVFQFWFWVQSSSNRGCCFHHFSSPIHKCEFKEEETVQWDSACTNSLVLPCLDRRCAWIKSVPQFPIRREDEGEALAMWHLEGPGALCFLMLLWDIQTETVTKSRWSEIVILNMLAKLRGRKCASGFLVSKKNLLF